jgi:hypothetical protein
MYMHYLDDEIAYLFLENIWTLITRRRLLSVIASASSNQEREQSAGVSAK